LLLRSFFLMPVLFFLGCNSSSADKARKKPAAISLIRLPQPVPLSAAETAKLKQACSLWYDTVLRSPFFNGGIIVAKGGNIVFEKYKGSNPLGSGDSVTGNTPFHIASVSKTFTAMAVLKLVENGQVNLDDDFLKYFPAFNYPGITIRNLLSHRSGLPNYLYFMKELGWDEKLAIKNQDVFNYLVNRKSALTEIAPPNTHFTYCNTNFALLALLIEKVSGLTYPAFLQQTFFAPLQMNNSFVFTIADSGRATPNYDWRGHAISDNYLDYVYGDKNIYSTPGDLLIWDRALSSGLLFKPETLEAAYQPYSNEKPGTKNYGLGWRMNIYPNGKKVIFHNGWWHGNNAAFIRLIDQDATIIVLGNRYNRGIYKAYQLVNSFDNYFEVLEIDE
jgi:CubicO group peptidase (beta-lactamase class C family)